MNKFTVLNNSGCVDIAASVEKYTAALREWITENETDVQRIATAVHSVFDNITGNVPMQVAVHRAVNLIDTAPDKFTALSKHVHAYIKGQADAGTFTIARGMNGGVSRNPRPDTVSEDSTQA